MNLESSVSAPPSLQTNVFHRSCFAMNTRFSMVLVGIDAETAETLAHGAQRDLRALEKLMSRFDAESPVSDLNRRAATEAVHPPEELWEVLALCREYWTRTKGAFDIAQRPLQELWRSSLRQDDEPSQPAIALAMQHAGLERLDFDDIARTVCFQRSGMSIDLGGFGKGFALERLAGSLRAQGVERAFLSFGESSITVLGSHPHGPSWPVGITSVFDPSRTLHTFHLRDASLSTSGTAPSNRMDGARIFGHILDPRTGRPVEGYRTLSVASPSAIEAEILSTALLVIPERERAEVLSGFSQVSAIEIVYHSREGEFVPRIQWKYGI